MNEKTKPNLLPEPKTKKEWEETVKKHARRIRNLISNQVFGWNIAGNRDAEIVAVYMKGLEVGRENSELILREILKQHGIKEPEKVQ